MPTPAIRWAANFDPAHAAVHVRNELTMAAPAAAVWDVLIRAADWPAFYANARNIQIEGGEAELFAGARFTWTTFGVRLQSVVEEFAPMERIAWSARAFGVHAWHAWLITPAEGGCLVITEETQHGLLARANRLVFPRRMGDWHQRWLEGLRARATKGPSPPS